jgi:hypothetical protein
MPWIKGGNLKGPTAVSAVGGNSSRLGSDGLLFTPAPAAYALPIATSSRLGGIKIGSGLSITADGLLSANASGTYVQKAGDNMAGPLRFSVATNPSTFNGTDWYVYQNNAKTLFHVAPGGPNIAFENTGQVLASAAPTSGSHLTNKTYVDTSIANIPSADLSSCLKKAGDSMTGPLRFSGTGSPSTFNGTDFYLYHFNGNLILRPPTSGSILFNGDGTISAGMPTAEQHLIRKDYGDSHYAAKALFDDLSAAVVGLSAELALLRDQVNLLAAASPQS